MVKNPVELYKGESMLQSLITTKNNLQYLFKKIIFLGIFLTFLFLPYQSLHAACGATNITWGGATSTWNTAGNWSPANVPNVATENAIINAGTVSSNATLTLGCLTIGGTGVLNGATAPARTITIRGDSFSAPSASSLLTLTNLSFTLGPHTTAGLPQTFTFNSAATIRGLTIPNVSVPGGGAFGVTVTNLNAGTAVFTKLANTGLNSSKYIGNIRATTYTNNRANSLELEAGTFQVNRITTANTVTGGSLNIKSGSRLITTTTFNPSAGFTTNVLNGTPKGILTATTTSAPAGILNVNGTMTTTGFNPTATSNVTIGTTGTVTSSGASAPLGTLTVNGLLSTTTFNPGSGTTTVNTGGTVTASSTSAPAGTLIVNGSLTTTQFNPKAASNTTIGATGSIAASTTATPLGTLTVNGTFSSTTLASSRAVTVNAGGSITATTSMTPAAVAASVISVSGSITTPIFNPLASSSVTVNSGGIISAASSSAPRGLVNIAAGGTFNVGTYSPTGTSTTNVFGNMTITTFTPAAAAIINVKSGGVLNITTFTPNATSAITVEAGGTLNITTMNNALAATVNIAGTATVTNMPTLTSGILNVQNGGRLIVSNGIRLNAAAATLRVQAGGTLQVANGQTVTLSNGTFQTLGTEDGFPQNLATKGVIEALSGGTFNFTTTGGTLNLVGFNFSRLGVNGLVIGGTTALSNLRGGQFSNLSTNYASMRAIQINTTGALPLAASNIAWTWGAFNNFTGTTPTSADAYKLVTSTGCAGRTIDFTGWTGDWYEMQPTFNVLTKISAVGCTINMSASASAVSLLYFNAVPFKKAIDLRWRTNAERMHLGFNVYRSNMYSAQFQQINKSLIRNIKNSGSNQVDYRFIDQDVINGERYYYYIEDVEVSGKKVLHGPVSAIAMENLGNPPADNPGENSETNPSDPTNDGGINPNPAPIPNPSYEDLGNGIKVLSKTSKTLRIEIIPNSPVFSVSGWNSAYQDVSISGYSKMTLEGSPELPEKDILIQVQSYATTAEVINASITESTFTGHLISPAPEYTLENGTLIPNYIPDTGVYNQEALYPSAYYSIRSELVTLNKDKFLKLRINPLKMNPLDQIISMSTKIVLDIGLDGDDWSVKPPVDNSELGPYSISNTLKIDYTKAGVYQIAYEDFVNSDVEGPFTNIPTNQWRLYYKNNEIPLEIHSSNGSFGPGDYIRFHAPFKKELESKKNQLILSPVQLMTSDNLPKRIEEIDVDPAEQVASSEALPEFTQVIEKNLKFIDGVTLNDDLDHFFYADLVNYPGMDTLNVAVTLPEIDVTSSTDVQVKFHVRGRLSMSGLAYKHHVAFSLGDTIIEYAEFEENERQVLSFRIPANQFVNGINNLKMKVLGTFTPTNENDFVLVDKVEIIYRGFKNGTSNLNTFSIDDLAQVHRLDSFPHGEIHGYDITNPLEPKKMVNIKMTPDNNGGFDAHFYVDDESDNEGKKYYSILGNQSFLKPTSLALNSGLTESLKNSSNRADLIVYGNSNLISALQDLIDRRISQGLDVVTVTPEQVYSEFSYGVASSNALKDFMNTALSNWDKSPKYLLILGDGTYDPTDYNTGALIPSLRSALERSTIPAPLIAGRFIDFSSDNFFVSSANSHLPKLAVGRLPTNDPNKIRAYVNKIQKFEDGESAPTTNMRSISFFADQDLGDYERFNEHSRNMMSAATGFNNVLFDRLELGSKALTKEKIKSEFNAGPLIISLMGHGAFDRFGDDIFNVNDAKLLSNSILPIVANWNCESAYFYDANNSYKSLAEELIFNPNGGAIVYMGSTTQTTPPAQAKLALNFFSQLSSTVIKPWEGIRFGELLYHAKIGVGDNLYEKDIVNSFSIIGDPSLKLPEELFAANSIQNIGPQSQDEQKASSSSFGCDANADDGALSHSPWYSGLIEFIIYMGLILLGTRRLRRHWLN